jgi:hypothetical protein
VLLVSEPEPTGLRIGDAERRAAMAALDAHLEAGRLDGTEYGERSASASVARTVDDLRPLFVDLPPPHPPQLAGGAVPAAGAPSSAGAPLPAGIPASAGTVATSSDHGPGALARWGPRASAVMPLLAVILFFTVPIAHPWVFFLLIPLAGALFAGSRDDDHDDRRRDRRDDRRDRDRD